MSIDSIARQIASVDREINTIEKSIHYVDAKISRKSKEANTILSKISKEKDIKRVISFQKNLTKKNEEISKLEKNKSTKSKSLADKQKKKLDFQSKLIKEVDNYMPLMDEEVEFTLTVYNAGPQDATGVVIQDILPFGLSYVSDSGGYNSGTGIWTIGNLNNGETVTRTLRPTVNPTGNHYDEAIVSGNELDADLSNNISEIQVYPMYPLTEIILACATMNYDLTNVTIGNPPPGAELSWHTESPADDGNKISTPNDVKTNQTYYIAYYDPIQNCYGSTSEVKIKRSCLITNPMIRQRMKR